MLTINACLFFCRERGRQSYLIKKGKEGNDRRLTRRSMKRDYDDRSDAGSEDLSLGDEDACQTTPERRPSATSSDDDGMSEQSDDHDYDDMVEESISIEEAKLSSNFNYPLGARLVAPSTVPSTSSSSSGGNNNLMELARVHQRVISLEKQAEQAKILSSKFYQEQEKARKWEQHSRKLEVELARYRDVEMTWRLENARLRQELEGFYMREDEISRKERALDIKRPRGAVDPSVEGAVSALLASKKHKNGMKAGAAPAEEKESTPPSLALTSAQL